MAGRRDTCMSPLGPSLSRRGKTTFLILAAAVLGASPAWAQTDAASLTSTIANSDRFKALRAAVQDPAQAPAPEPAAKPVKVLIGADMPTVYFFRGYRQEADPAFTFQPFVDVGFTGEAASLNVGLWNSFHSGSLKDADLGYYETDFYAAATVGMVKATYTAYLYPEIDDSAIHEIMFSASFPHALAPSAAIAFEFAKPEGLDKGIYLELGVAPAIPMGDDPPVSITVPVKVGLSLKDYYGEDTFGYFSGGVTIGKAINDHFEVHGGVTVYGFGDTLKAVNNGDSAEVVGSVGFSVGF